MTFRVWAQKRMAYKACAPDQYAIDGTALQLMLVIVDVLPWLHG